MRPHALLPLVALLLGAGLVVLLFGRELWGPGGRPDERAREAGEEAEPGEDSSSTPAGARGAGRVRGAVLFGRPRERHEGVGLVRGQVALAETGEPVPGASLVLAGQASAGAPASVRGRTRQDGSFRLADVPGGDVYVLRITAPDLPERTLPGIQVLPGSVARLGTIWLGAKAAFAGRVVDAADRPVPDADIRAHIGSSSLLDLMGNLSELLSTLDREPEPVARTTSRKDGTFTFEALDPGPVVLTVRAAGHAAEQRTAVVPPAGSQKHALLVRLAPGTEVTGRVVDGAGRGIGGARVALVSENDPSSFLYGRVFTRTESDGRFRVDAAGTGSRALLLAAATGFPTTSHRVPSDATNVEIVLRRDATLTIRFLVEPDGIPLEGARVHLVVGTEADTDADDSQTFGAGTTDRFGAVQVDTRAGRLQMLWVQHPERATGIWMGGDAGAVAPGVMEGPEDPTVHPGAQEMVFRLQAGFVVRGRVTGPNGEPVAGARVSNLGGISFARPALTDTEGRYQLYTTTSPQMSGFSAVMVRAEGYVQDEASLWVDATQIRGGTLEHDVEMSAASVVSGRVVDAEGTPVVGAQVRVNPQDGMLVALDMLTDPSGVSGPGGRYVLDGVPPGAGMRVLARHPAFVDGRSAPFELRSGASKTGLDVVLRPGRTLEIDVTGPGGRPVAGAKVELAFEAETSGDWGFVGAFGHEATRLSDVRGRVLQDRVPKGTILITASHPDFASSKKEVQVAEGSPDTMTIVLVLKTSSTITGRVLDTAGRPVGSALVIAMPSGDEAALPRSATTKADGAFRIERLPPGQVVLHVRAAGHASSTETVRAPASNLPLRLTPLDTDAAKRR